MRPANADLARRLRDVASLRESSRPTLPVPLGNELACNPFLRVDTTGVIDWARRQGSGEDRVARFAALRRAKDDFRA